MSDSKTKSMTVSRRQFLLGSAALGGSLMLP
ncbi:twin-arginine translocation signal domain-containing protein, partial [Pectobacterium brasiliense]